MVTTGPVHDLFLAHAKPDQPVARELYRQLHQLQPDLDVFLDIESLLPGDRWDRVIPEAQRASRATVVLLSPRSDNAWYLGDEVATAIAMHRAAPAAHRVLPVLLEPVASMPYGLAIIQAIDAAAVGGLAGVAAKLRDAVTRLRGQYPGPTPPPAPPPTPSGGCDPNRLLGRLERVTDVLFEKIVFLSGVDRNLLHASTAPLAQRALDLAQLARLDPALCQRLDDLLDLHAPWTR